jgi:drug/metabolite transporter (DMT)-like permease
MVVAALALSPFVLQLKQELRVPAVLCGFFTCMGYVTQSLALVDTDPARVSFLGSLTVLWCPVLEAIIDKKPMSLKEAPQTWLAAFLCIAGIGVLELFDPNATEALSLSVSTGDVFALLQAVGFGTGVWWTSRMLKQEPHQALPVTATLLATTAFLSMIWCLVDGWMFAPDPQEWQHYTLPGLLTDPSLRAVAGAVLWTGLISTSLNFFIELTALGRVPPSEASVILASEPLWAALFAAALYGTGLSAADSVGGALIVMACLVNAVLEPSSFDFLHGDNAIANDE